MLGIACSGVPLRNCPEGMSGEAMRDRRALAVDPVIFVALMRIARTCVRLFLQIQSKKGKKNSQLVAFCVTES